MSRLLSYGVIQQRRKITLGFEAFVASSSFDRTAQPVDIYDVFANYYITNEDAKYIYSFTSSIATLSLPSVSGISYRWGETISGVDYVYDVSSGTAFTSGSTKRYVIVSNTSASFSVQLVNGVVWCYLGNFTISNFYSTDKASYLTTIHAHDLSNIVALDYNAFRRNYNLTGNLTIPDQLTSLPNWCFSECNKITGAVVFPNNMINITGGWIFYQATGITSVDYNNVLSTGAVSFSGCTGITSINLRNCTQIDAESFYGCTSLNNVVVPDSCTIIKDKAFFNCTGLTNLTLNNYITSIGVSAFQRCTGLSGTLSIPTSVTSIGALCWAECTGFSGTLTIPSSVLSIGEGCFYDDNFNALVSYSSNIVVDDYVLYDIGQSGKIISIHSQKGYSGTLTFRTGTTRIGNYTFYGNSRTGGITILSTITSIGNNVFSYCTGFTGNLTIPDTVISLSPYCLSYIRGTMGNLTFGTGVAALPDYTCVNSTGFYGTLTLPSNCTTCGYQSFEGCNNFTGDLVLPSTCTVGSSRNFRATAWNGGSLIINNTNLVLSNNNFEGAKFTTLVLPANYIGTATAYSLYFALCPNWTGSSLDTAWRNIVPGTSLAWKTFTIGSANKTKLLAHNANAETEAATNYLYIV